ncbi:MAG: hypothetical protein ACJA13_003916 [Paraglaciecola sp.]|jgi:hypothetical protein
MALPNTASMRQNSSFNKTINLRGCPAKFPALACGAQGLLSRDEKHSFAVKKLHGHP